MAQPLTRPQSRRRSAFGRAEIAAADEWLDGQIDLAATGGRRVASRQACVTSWFT